MSTQKQNPKNAPELSEAKAERLIYEAFKLGGKFLPQTPAEVEAAEAEIAGKPVELPPSLRDPLAILMRKPGSRAVVKFPAPTDTDVVENMACAAKNGAEIPPDVLDQMDTDEAQAAAKRGGGDGK